MLQPHMTAVVRQVEMATDDWLLPSIRSEVDWSTLPAVLASPSQVVQGQTRSLANVLAEITKEKEYVRCEKWSRIGQLT